MKKALLISNLAIKFTNFIVPPIEILQELGYEVHTCANYSNFKDDKSKYNVIMHHIDFERNPFNIKNIKAYKQLLKLMREEKFDLVHCNTPIGGLLGRICAKKTKVPKVIYTAHGFHFYKGAPLVNNILYKNVEKILAKCTDILITMNKEDYEAAQKFTLRKNGKVMFVHGVGMDCTSFNIRNFNKTEYREKLGIKEDDIMIISAGDLIKRKNYKIAIEAIAKCNQDNIKYLICGTGTDERNLKNLVNELNVNEKVYLLGYRNDMKYLMNCADIFLFTTKQEGLPRSMMEAMSAGLPCVASKIRGNVDLIEDGKGGFLNVVSSSDEFAESILTLANNKDKRNEMGKFNKNIVKKFDTENVKEELLAIYRISEEI